MKFIDLPICFFSINVFPFNFFFKLYPQCYWTEKHRAPPKDEIILKYYVMSISFNCFSFASLKSCFICNFCLGGQIYNI